jgi:hypothetical protein
MRLVEATSNAARLEGTRIVEISTVEVEKG